MRSGDFEYQPSLDPDEGPPSQSGDSEDDSVEDVRPKLEEYARQLEERGDLPPDPTGAPDEYLLESEADTSGVMEALETFAETLRNALGDAGLVDADLITAENLRRIPPETLRQLNPQTAEFIYFDTFRRNRKWLGEQPVRLVKWLSRANLLVRHGVNLENMMLNHRANNLGDLYEIGIDSDQLVELSSGTPEAQHTIDRLFFFLSDEPRLSKFSDDLKRNAAIDGPYAIETVVIDAQNILKQELEKMQDGKAKDEMKDWVDEIYAEKYENATHRIGSIITIGDKILETLRETATFEDFLRRTEQ